MSLLFNFFLTYFMEYFDNIVCVNLATRPDRRMYAIKTFNKLNIPATIVVFQKHSKGGIYGCFDSHIQLIKKAYEEGKNNLLVFEDDLSPTNTYSIQHIQRAIEFMRNNQWDIFYFGYFVYNYNINPLSFIYAPIVSSNIVKYNPFATHAYCVSRQGMKKILDSYKQYIGRIHYDIFLSKYVSLDCYCYTPMLFDQKMCFTSDIEPGNITERILRVGQCFEDKNKIFWKVSFMKDFIDNNLFFICFVIFVLTIKYLNVI